MVQTAQPQPAPQVSQAQTSGRGVPEVSSSVVGLVDAVLVQAHELRASDVHLEPTREMIRVRFRIDGVLEDQQSLPSKLHQSIISRIKIIAQMDVAERRVAQDGRVRVKAKDQELDLRIATYPTIFGEAVAIRILSKEKLLTLNDLGFQAQDKENYMNLIQKAHGIILVTGPTGSGKSSTLYASLLNINRKEKHVLSVEDPVESEIDWVDQTQINHKAGVTFASVIRSMMRQDPDIIMVGEIRDQETADTAFRCAMTGHLVFSTLHANTAVAAINRLIDLGVDKYLISSSLIGVLAQRLVRIVCKECKGPGPEIGPKDTKILRIKPPFFPTFKGKGCKTCRNRGYKGRIGVYELVTLDETLKRLINENAHEAKLYEHLESQGFTSMTDDGLIKVKQGTTSIEEIRKVAADRF